MRKETDRWFRQAEADLETAMITLDGGRFYAAAQFAEQAAEKALKALYIERKGLLPPRTHELKRLGEEFNAPENMLTELDAMADKYLAARYPDATVGLIPAESINQESAEWHLDLAQRTLAWVRKQLSTQ